VSRAAKNFTDEKSGLVPQVKDRLKSGSGNSHCCEGGHNNPWVADVKTVFVLALTLINPKESI
jgi:hypothetical protein